MNKHAHIIGIAGLGMTALATYMKELGWEVTGSDAGSYDPSKTYLKEKEISYNIEYSESNLPSSADIFIIGKHAKLTKENPEVGAALASGKEVISMAEMWGRLSSETENTLVVGSYGKSTCTAILSHCLITSGKDPHYFIGAIPHTMSLSHKGTEKIFIMEGDEYPSSNFDTTSKFLYFTPKNVLLTSGEHDHFNIFPTEASYLKPYEELLKKLSEKNILVAAIDQPNVKTLLQKTDARIVTYSKNSHDGYFSKNIQYGDITKFELWKGSEKIADLSTQLLGTYNIENIVGASAMILENEWLTPDELRAVIGSFTGLRRRLDLLTKNSSVKVFEGFGSSYTKAKTAIEAIKLHFPEQKLYIVFEPHTFSWRKPESLGSYDNVFDGGDFIYVLQPPAKDGKDVQEQLSLEQIVERVKKSGIHATGFTKGESILNNLKENTHKDDIILILSSGEVDGLVKKIPEWVEGDFS